MTAETLQIKIAPEHCAAHDDDLNRLINGWFHGISPHEAWWRARGVWNLNPFRALAVSDVEIVGGPDDHVLAIVTVDGIEEFHGKYALVGTVRPDDLRIGHPSVHRHPSRNRINYYRPRVVARAS